MKSKNAIHSFWKWFQGNAPLLAANPEDQRLIDELEEHVRKIHPGLSWEIGPGIPTGSQFVVSPNLDRDLRPVAHETIAAAPRLPGWQFFSTRPPKKWDFKVQMKRTDEEVLLIDASSWTYVLLKYPDGSYEILLARNEADPSLSEEERQQLSEIVLESILGEDILINLNGEYELLDELEPRFAGKAKSVRDLWAAFVSSKTPN